MSGPEGRRNQSIRLVHHVPGEDVVQSDVKKIALVQSRHLVDKRLVVVMGFDRR